MTVLLLGGTTEARHLAALLADERIAAVTSLAGAVAAPQRPEGEVRIGGFGGVDGLADYLRDQGVTLVVDATHPFAARMTANAAAACARVGVPLVRLSRPGWSDRPEAAGWHWVDSIAAAREVAGGIGERVFLALGRQSLPEFAEWDDRPVLARVVEAPSMVVPRNWTLVRARGPFPLADELDLLRSHAIDVLVTKDSGGPTDAKLSAAAQLGIAVVVIRRPPTPQGAEVVSSPDEALAWLSARLA